MAQDAQQAWNPVEDFKTKYPSSGYSDQEIYKNLSNPSMFKSAFPHYAHLGDDEIKQGLGQFASKYAPAAPNAGLAAPAGAPSTVDVHEWDNTRPEGTYLPGESKKLDKSGMLLPHPMPGSGEGANLASGLSDYVDATAGRAVDGGYDIARGNIKKGLHKEVQAVGNAALPTVLPLAAAAAPLATLATVGAGATLGYGGKKIAQVSGGDADTQNLAEDAGNIIGGGLAGKGFALRAKAKALDAENAFNVISKGNASSNEPSVLPEVRNAAATEAQTNPANPITSKYLGAKPKLNVPKGKAGVRKIEDVSQKAIDAHEAETQPIKQQFASETIDNASAGDAARSQITPEMRVAAANGDKGVASQIAAIEEVAARAEGAKSISNADQLRHSWNDELSGDYSKSEAAQSVAPAVTQAKRVTLNTLRQNFYNRLGELSGQDLSPVAKREGLLLESKAALRKSGDTALEGGARNDKSFMGRVLTGSDRDAGGVSSVAPAKASLLELPLNVLKALNDKDFGTPVGDYQARVKRSLSNLPAPKPVQAPPFPGGRLPVQQSLPQPTGTLFPPHEQTPYTPPGSTSVASLLDSSLLEPGTGTASGTHSPYKPEQPVAAAVTPQDRAAMEGAEFGGFKIGSDETPTYGRTRRPLVTEEHPEIDAVPDFIKQLFAPKNGPKQLPPASSIQLGPSLLTESAPSSSPKTEAPVGANDRSAGLAARKGGSAIPERGKGFVTNEAAERRALPRSTQAQLLTSEANEIRRSIQDSTSPEEKHYNEQRLMMKQDELTRLNSSGDLPEAHGAVANSAPFGQSDIPAPVRDALGLTQDRGKGNQVTSRLPGVKETMMKTNDTYTKVEAFVRTQPTIGLTMLKEKFGFSTSEAVSMLDQLESKGVVKAASGSGPRKVAGKAKAQAQGQ